MKWVQRPITKIGLNNLEFGLPFREKNVVYPSEKSPTGHNQQISPQDLHQETMVQYGEDILEQW